MSCHNITLGSRVGAVCYQPEIHDIQKNGCSFLICIRIGTVPQCADMTNLAKMRNPISWRCESGTSVSKQFPSYITLVSAEIVQI